MLFDDAQRALAAFLSPVTVDAFLDEVLTGGFRKIAARGPSARTELLGPLPQALLSGAYHLSPRLNFHSVTPLGPPPSLEGVADAAEFGKRIAQFHARNYSVGFPDLRPLSPPLDRLARALEVLLHQPVTASAFWSRAGLRAPVHYDDHDLIVVQLRGAKRWRISTRPSQLPNTWTGAETTPEMGPHETIDVAPGDVLYLPRGTFHDVESHAESLHVSIGFTPLTARDALIACIDHLSDLDPALRGTLGQRLAFQLRGQDSDRLAPAMLTGASRLLAACQTPGFMAHALQRRSSRVVTALPALPASAPPAITLESILVRRDTAFCHVTATAEMINFSYPGGQLRIHRGAGESLMFMVNTAKFSVRDIPGQIGDDVRLSLAAKLVEVGILDVLDRANHLERQVQTAAAH